MYLKLVSSHKPYGNIAADDSLIDRVPDIFNNADVSFQRDAADGSAFYINMFDIDTARKALDDENIVYRVSNMPRHTAYDESGCMVKDEPITKWTDIGAYKPDVDTGEWSIW